MTACSVIVQRYGQSTSPEEANTVGDCCAVGPAALAEFQPAIRAARLAVEDSPEKCNWHNTLGAILYRAKQNAAAIEELKESVRLNPVGGSSFDFLFLAMAHHRLGKGIEARSWLDKAAQAHAKQSPTFWTDRLEWQLLHREAEALLKEPPPEPRK
jgi:tetratricopeptide (TPR) repeat protein